jgi:hypothetical protein
VKENIKNTKSIFEEVPLVELDLNVSAVLKGEGADPKQIYERRPQLVAVAECALKSGLSLISPVFYRKHLDLEGSRRLIQDIFKDQKWIQDQLINAEAIDFVICTIGPDLENLSSMLMSQDGPLALALDGLANAAVDRLASMICKKISCEVESKGYQISLPMGPGSPEWPVEQGQPVIFRLINPDNHIVRLTESYLMIPRKSNSFLIVSGKGIQTHGKSCDFCNLKETCRYKIRKIEPV